MSVSQGQISHLYFFFAIVFLVPFEGYCQADSTTYLEEVKFEMEKEWPNNRTINLIFHGHSVPSGYYQSPTVKRFEAYPFLALRDIKSIYSNAVVNTITTSIGGESSRGGSARFNDDVPGHKPDVLFIDYALNDRNIVTNDPDASLAEARTHWISMIKDALDHSFKVLVMTPTPATNVDITAENNLLERHSQQIRFLADSFNIGLVDSYQAFTDLVKNGANLNDYMVTGNHPNDAGHEIVAKEIFKWFKPTEAQIFEANATFKFDTAFVEGDNSFTLSESGSSQIELFENAEIVADEERFNVLSLEDVNSHGLISGNPIGEGDFSISFWYKRLEQKSWQQLFYFSEMEGRHLIALTEENWFPQKAFVFYRNTVAGVSSTGIQIEQNTWKHVVFVVRSGSAMMYLDGERTSFVDFNLTDFSFSKFYLGSISGKTALSRLDDLYFFENAISDEQVLDLYEDQKQAEPANNVSPPLANYSSRSELFYPNPADSTVYITLDQFEKGEIVMMDASRKVLKTEPISKKQKTYEMDVSGLTPGLYFVEVRSKRSSSTYKLLIKH